MKFWKAMAAILLLVSLAGTTACSAFGGQASASQAVEVKSGDLLVKVSGTGKTLVATDAKLAFDVGGKIAKMYVKKGDKVSKGMTLAELKTDDMELALTQVKVALSGQQVAVTQSELGVKVAEHAVAEARDIYTWPPIETAKDDLADAKAYYEYTVTNAMGGGAGAGQWTGAAAYAKVRVAMAQAKLDAMVNSYDTEEVAIKKKELELAQQTQALNVQTLAQAEAAVKQARRQLDSAVIKSEIDGVVADTYFEQGDNVQAGAKVMYLIDPASIEVNTEIDEVDILRVTAGQKAVLSLDALPEAKLEGKVKSIAQLPQSGSNGLVKYAVKIEIVRPQGDLKTGMSASADVVVDERSGVILVPNKAVRRDSQNAAFVEIKDGEATRQHLVVPGATDGTQSEIVSGLKVGDLLAVR